MGSAVSSSGVDDSDLELATFLGELQLPSGKEYDSLYGRLDRALVENGQTLKPTMLSSRPTKSVSFEKPFSFVMGPELLTRIPQCKSLYEMLSSVLSIAESTATKRIELVKAGKLDHVLMLFSSHTISVQPATLDGIHLLLKEDHEETAKRIAQILPNLHQLLGPENFQKRIDTFSQHWTVWEEEVNCMWVGIASHRDTVTAQRTCNCRYVSYDSYCQEFDAAVGDDDKQLLLSRELLVKLLGCNELCGFDGITYDKYGTPGDKEYLAKNVSIVGNSHVSTIVLSSVDRFKA